MGFQGVEREDRSQQEKGMRREHWKARGILGNEIIMGAEGDEEGRQ